MISENPLLDMYKYNLGILALLPVVIAREGDIVFFLTHGHKSTLEGTKGGIDLDPDSN